MHTSSHIEHLSAAWYRWAGAHAAVVHIVLAALVVCSLFYVHKLPVDPDWLNLFHADDPALAEYLRFGNPQEAANSLYVKLSAASSERDAELVRQLTAAEGVAGVSPLPGGQSRPDSAESWFVVSLMPTLLPSERSAALQRVDEFLQDAGVEYGLTGAEQILKEFRASVQVDFIYASLVSLCLVVGILVAAFGLNLPLFLGLVYELAGLTVALAACVAWTGSLNMLSAALPCVLVGLGADFVIHCMATAGAGDESGEMSPMHIFHRVAKPMFWGAMTTAAAFASLGLADLRGLGSVGALGALGVFCMFGSVMLLLPPVLARHAKRVRKPFMPAWIPARQRRRLLAAVIVVIICAGLSPFALTLETEQNIENLYDSTMPSLRLQQELTEVLGAYPSPLYVKARVENPEALPSALAQKDLPFVPDLSRLRVSEDETGSLITVPVLPKRNPFDQGNFEALVKSIDDSMSAVGARDVAVTGDAKLSHHLNQLLQRGMLRALLAVFVVLAFSLGFAFRRLSLVVLPMISLCIALLGILGALGLLGIRMSAYTLTLIPLFLGIGIDDLFIVTHGRQSNPAKLADSSLEFAIFLTTVTTVVGYGSLLTARNNGFVAMGTTALVGLVLMYLAAAFVLPSLLFWMERDKLIRSVLESEEQEKNNKQ